MISIPETIYRAVGRMEQTFLSLTTRLFQSLNIYFFHLKHGFCDIPGPVKVGILNSSGRVVL
ncbi:MAG: hypothetical protein WD317_11920 [Balneolaceae bacterium]